MHYKSHRLQFYMSAESECPYLDDKRERKIFTTLAGDGADRLHNKLSREGFRRSQNIVYKPVCQNCAGCLSARVPVNDYSRTKSQRRVLAKNRTVVREIHQAIATDEQYDVFERYIHARHKDGGMCDMNIHDYASMIEQATTPTRLFEYRIVENGRPGPLIAVSLTDVLDDGLSMVYSFFDPDLADRSLGTFMILDHMRKCQEAQLPYLYLGYWVNGSVNMAYKQKFRPLELFINGKWTRFDDPSQANPVQRDVQQVLRDAQKAITVDIK